MADKKRAEQRRIKADALVILKQDKELAKYADSTLQRMAGKLATLAAHEAKPKAKAKKNEEIDTKDLEREISKPQIGMTAGGGMGIFGAQELDNLKKQHDPKTVSYRKLKEMREHGHVQLGLTARKAPVISTLSKIPEIISDDPEVSAFLTAALMPSWRTLVRTSFNADDFGFQAHEKRFVKKDIEWMWNVRENDEVVKKTASKEGRWIPKTYKDLDPEGLKIWVDDEGSFAGITEKGRDTLKELIPAPKTFLFTLSKEFGNLFGKSVLARSYDPYCHYRYAEFFCGRYFERFGEPGIKVMFDPSPAVHESGQTEIRTGDLAVTAAESYKGSGIVAVPSSRDDDGKLKNDFEIINDDRRGDVWIKLLEFWLTQVLRSLLIPERVLTQDSRLGSFGMAKAHTDTFFATLQQSIEQFIEHVNRFILPQLIDVNLGKDRARAFMVAPSVSQEHRNILLEVFNILLSKDDDARAAIDALKIFKELNIPTIEPETHQSAHKEEEEDLAQKSYTRNTVTSNHLLSDYEEATLQKNEAALNKLAEKLMKGIEGDLDDEIGAVKKKIFGFEEDMRKVALGFLSKAKLDDEGRIEKKGNQRTLDASIKKIDKIGEEMQAFYDDKDRGSRYLATFGDRGIDDFTRLADLYDIPLPRGLKSAVRDETLARGFGASLRSFLENLGRVAERTKSGISEALTTGFGRREVVDAVKRNGRFIGKAARRVLDTGIAGATGATKSTLSKVKTSVPSIEKQLIRDEEFANPKVWSSALLGAAAGFVIEDKLSKEEEEDVESVMEEVTDTVSNVDLMDASDTLPGRIEELKTHRGFVDLTVEGPARGAYRWTLFNAAQLAGWDLWKFFKGPKTREVQGKPAASSLKYDGTLGTREWWNAEGIKEGSEEPLQQYLFHFGDRDYTFPIPLAWAEEQGLEFKKAGGE